MRFAHFDRKTIYVRMSYDEVKFITADDLLTGNNGIIFSEQ